ncbi:MAG: pseudouridine synthase [Eubacteriales bacterium]
MRLQKYLAINGIGSRRKCEELIQEGKIRVNDHIITAMGTTIDPEKDKIYFNHHLVEIKQNQVYIMLNKPTGYISTVKDNFDRKTVLALISLDKRIYPVGRLDYDSEGLLILTDDGSLTYRLTHPKHHIHKVYQAKLKGKPSTAALEQFRNGLIIDGYRTSKAQIKILKEYRNNTLVEIQIWEGRNRQIRKMCQEIGHTVIKLKRIAIGPLKLGELETGKWRYLTAYEIKSLKDL